MKIFHLLLFVTISIGVQAQVTYYTTNGTDRLTKSQLEQEMKAMKAEMSEALNKEMFVNFSVKRTEELSDSIIHHIALAMSDKPAKPVVQKPEIAFLNEVLPDFELVTLGGETITRDDLKGKPTLINFWFTSCPPCIDEMPVLNQIQEAYQEDFNFVAITFQSKKSVKKFLKKHPFHFKHVLDAQVLIDQLKIESYPKNIILDENGVVKYVKNGIPYTRNDAGEFVIGDGKAFIALLETMKK